MSTDRHCGIRSHSTWSGREGRALSGTSVLPDVLFETDQVFPAGGPIRLTVLLNSACSDTPTCLHCQGRIVRAEKNEEKMGVAVAFTSYQFEPLAV